MFSIFNKMKMPNPKDLDKPVGTVRHCTLNGEHVDDPCDIDTI